VASRGLPGTAGPRLPARPPQGRTAGRSRPDKGLLAGSGKPPHDCGLSCGPAQQHAAFAAPAARLGAYPNPAHRREGGHHSGRRALEVDLRLARRMRESLPLRGSPTENLRGGGLPRATSNRCMLCRSRGAELLLYCFSDRDLVKARSSRPDFRGRLPAMSGVLPYRALLLLSLQCWHPDERPPRLWRQDLQFCLSPRTVAMGRTCIAHVSNCL
jgi:hypothetical protein